MTRHRHDRACAVVHEYVVGDPDRDVRPGRRVVAEAARDYPFISEHGQSSVRFGVDRVRLPDGDVLEEIKSTTRDLAGLETHQNELHWAQLKIYAWYDNEMGYAHRLADVAMMVGNSL